MNRQAHALVERCIGRVQVIVPKFVARIVPVGGQIEHEGTSLA